MNWSFRVSNSLIVIAGAACALAGAGTALAQDQISAGRCPNLPGYETLHRALTAAVASETSGLNNQMWGTIVDRDGVVCAVAFSGNDRGAQWLGSRAIAAQKANTANAYSLDASSNSNGSGQPGGLALSTANLYAATQPGGSLFGLQASNPVDPAVAYGGPSQNYGTAQDPMVGRKIGGVNVFGGGLPLYDSNHNLVGGVGVSGDTSCADHNISYRVRHNLNLDHLAQSNNLPAVAGPAGLFAGDPTHPDNIIFDMTTDQATGLGVSKSGFGHPACLNSSGSSALPPVQP